MVVSKVRMNQFPGAIIPRPGFRAFLLCIITQYLIWHPGVSSIESLTDQDDVKRLKCAHADTQECHLPAQESRHSQEQKQVATGVSVPTVPLLPLRRKTLQYTSHTDRNFGSPSTSVFLLYNYKCISLSPSIV